MKILPIIALFLTLGGCATGYGPAGARGGYSETAYAPNVYRVNFKGNDATSQERASDLALLRCAELALLNGYTHLVITDSESWQSAATLYMPGSSQTTVSGSATTYGNTVHGSATSNTTYNPAMPLTIYAPRVGMVVVFTNNPEGSLDAQFLYDSLTAKYNINSK